MAASEQQLQSAERVFNQICNMLNSINFRYDTDRRDEDFRIICTVNGDDIPMKMYILVRPSREVVSLLSPMPFMTPEDKRVEMAMAVAVANYGLIEGTFDYDINDGEIRYRLTASYYQNILSEDYFNHMLQMAAFWIDKYNDRFMMVAKGNMSLQQFIDAES